MESEGELEQSSTLKLPLMFPSQSPDHPSGMATPPLHTSASVPFLWEEEPGKPRPCTALILSNNPKSQLALDLPPRLLSMDSKITKMPSPTTVLDGPYVAGGRSLFQSSSFKFPREGQGYFGNCSSSLSLERGQLGEMVLGNSKRLFGSWGQGAVKKGDGEGSFVFSTSTDIEAGFFDIDDESGGSGRNITKVKMRRVRRNGSFSSLSQVSSNFWAAIYKGFKQVLPWSRKSKKQSLII